MSGGVPLYFSRKERITVHVKTGLYLRTKTTEESEDRERTCPRKGQRDTPTEGGRPGE